MGENSCSPVPQLITGPFWFQSWLRGPGDIRLHRGRYQGSLPGVGKLIFGDNDCMQMMPPESCSGHAMAGFP